MAIIAVPATLVYGAFSIGQQRFDLSEMSEQTGASQDRLLGPPRWRISAESPSGAGLSLANASEWEAIITKLRGRVNFLAVYDPVRVAPRGTMRGTLTLSGSHAQGLTVLTITGGAGQAGTTLLRGDWLQVGSGTTGQLFKVMDDATANGSGVIAANVEPPVRPAAGYAGGTAVTWDKPLGHYKLIGSPSMGGYVPGTNTMVGFSMDLMEQWT